ncbi:MAG TPA: sporulation peptidase YabG [Clostridiaceae bacterium]|mgnify:FL=1|jgi:spore coat assembly protein|nr:sporulation peptidase YabG [Clostridia bacterium]CDC07032.1 sporulation peptidase YabG [Clostridium sp. CAG:343]HCF34061.1 sporulation peptidase YabG [Clostridiales bacterium]HJJ19244.1 sporulation peptidase YabG [Clostridiaceae bacterium]MBP8633724.1 sporulation peptidase YabG [Clostridia bacterium]
MNDIKKGDIVVRKSYGKDIIFRVINILNKPEEKIAVLNGVIERIEADSKIADLELVDKQKVKDILRKMDSKIENRIEKSKQQWEDRNYRIGVVTNQTRAKEKIITGEILHLDGDRKYSEKSYRYYRKLGLNAIVKYIPEYRQPRVVYQLLESYNPDILVITGHDGMIKRGMRYNDIYNYRNSRYFIETVKEARKYDKQKGKKLVIFAGACQSYFEAIISAGANFASSPARILIDFLDPLVVAEKIALTEKYKYITIDDIAYELRDGRDGIGGIGANGKMTKC